MCSAAIGGCCGRVDMRVGDVFIAGEPMQNMVRTSWSSNIYTRQPVVEFGHAEVTPV